MSGPSVRIPLFPLGTVLFPGVVLPLHIFEERYRALVRELLTEPDPERRRFGVVAIRRGREVGTGAVQALHPVGTVALLSEAHELPDGRFRVVAVGTERFRVLSLGGDAPYPEGDVVLLGDPLGDASRAAAARATLPTTAATFRTYLQALGARRGSVIEVPELPDDPTLVAHLVAATVLVDLPVRQQLLEEPDTAALLAAETALMRRETQLLSAVAATPAPDLTRAPQSPN
ncbi:MAG TPA: LON peptidase substrate-binding domain-containing protein [Mycobacteriales bacterium]|jgi:Lon protease-like protein|nr:LON peptidase substrate-binding domain-containing protein [Mycobacteriales bacterium]